MPCVRPSLAAQRRTRTAVSAAAAGGSAFLAQIARAAEEKPGGILRVAAYSNPSRLDPSTGTNGADHAFLWPMFDTLVDQLRKGPYILGERFSAADLLWGLSLRWMTAFKIVEALPEIMAYVQRIESRPSFAKVTEADAKGWSQQDFAVASNLVRDQG